MALLVVQDGGADENPVEPAVSDDRLLPVFVVADLAQEKRDNELVEKRAAVPGVVAGAKPRDADQARDLIGLHRAHQRPRCGGGKRHLPERAGGCAERADDGDPSFERLAQGLLVAGISGDERRPVEVNRFLGRACENRDIAPSCQSLADDQATGSTGRTKNQDLAWGSRDRVAHGACMVAPL